MFLDVSMLRILLISIRKVKDRHSYFSCVNPAFHTKQNQQPLAKKLVSYRSTNKYYHSFTQTARDPFLDGTVAKQSHAINAILPDSIRLRRSPITAFVR